MPLHPLSTPFPADTSGMRLCESCGKTTSLKNKLCDDCKITLRWCSYAKHVVLLEDFTGYSNKCKNCEAVRQRLRTLSKIQVLAEIKVARGCADCGYNANPVALDFDHRPGENKLFNISHATNNRSVESLLQEVAKCDVRCANCHRIITHTRREAILRP